MSARPKLQKHSGEEGIEEEGPRVLHQHRHHLRDAEASPARSDLAARDLAGRARVVEADLGDRDHQLARMHAELDLDVEAGRDRRKALHEAAREGAIARADVGDGAAEEAAVEPVEGALAEGPLSAWRAPLPRRRRAACRPPCRPAR